jgi:hypothetical protein
MLVDIELQTFYSLARNSWGLHKLRHFWGDNRLSLVLALVFLFIELVISHNKSHRLLVLQMLMGLNLFWYLLHWRLQLILYYVLLLFGLLLNSNGLPPRRILRIILWLELMFIKRYSCVVHSRWLSECRCCNWRWVLLLLVGWKVQGELGGIHVPEASSTCCVSRLSIQFRFELLRG